MIKKIVKGILNEVKKIVSFDEHVRNLKWIRWMGKAVLVPKKNGDVFEHLHAPADHQAYIQKAKALGADLERQHKIWRNLVIKSYIGFFAFFIAACLVATQFSVFSMMTGIGAMSIFVAVWFNGSLLAYQIQHQQLDGTMGFFRTPSEWLPDPVFRPSIQGWRPLSGFQNK